MDWDSLRQQWRQDAPAASTSSIDELRSLDQALRKRVRRRDMGETAAAVVVAVFFAWSALDLAADAEWVALGFALLLVAWAVTVPLRLRRARREVPEEDPRQPLVENLGRQRDAALVQARMLERVWLWYLTPPAIGLFGMTLARSGPSAFALAYLAAVAVLYIGLAWINRRVARTQFRAHAERLQRQIDALGGEEVA